MIEVNISPFTEETTQRNYYLTDGTTIVIYTLSPTKLLSEKITAYKDRGHVRDLYDIYYLLDLTEPPQELHTLLPLERPENFDGLNDLILVGATPDFTTIEREVRRRAE